MGPRSGPPVTRRGDRPQRRSGGAAARSRGFPEIRDVQGDASALPFGPGSFDFVLSSMMLHYFRLDDAAGLLTAFARTAKRAVVIADIERHWFPYLAIGVLARLTGGRLVRRHFRSTVLEGFTRAELAGLARAAQFEDWRIRRYFPFRLTLVGELGEDRYQRVQIEAFLLGQIFALPDRLVVHGSVTIHRR
jgi:ubiquinone/menaquinone biosynthesis C-methylase UbiE